MYEIKVSEVRCDYFDDLTNEWCVDVWSTDDPDEGGLVAARINVDTFEVKYTFEQFKHNQIILEVVKEKLKEILNN